MVDDEPKTHVSDRRAAGRRCSEAAAIPDRVAALRDALETRPLDDANAHRQRAEDSEDVTDRIDALEDALATYQRAADLDRCR